MEIGFAQALHVRDERLTTRHDACRLLYVSDIHLRNGRTDTLCRQVLESVTRAHPEVVLLGGDLVDRRSELGKLSELVGKLHDIAPVLAVGGNHDRQVGMTRVREAVEHGGGQWIHDGIARLTHGGRVIAVAGPGTAPPVDAHVRVLCAHNPRIGKTCRQAGYDLVLAGHLHRCQLVAWEYRDRLSACRSSFARHPGRATGPQHHRARHPSRAAPFAAIAATTNPRGRHVPGS